MKFCATYLWEKGKVSGRNPVSLVLQQVEVRNQSVLLACVCRGLGRDACAEVSGYFTEALVEWFHRECIELVEQRRTEAEMERRLQKELAAIVGELLRYSKTKGKIITMDCVGMLLVEQKFWMFATGSGRIFLLNRRYNEKNMRCVMRSTGSKNMAGSFSWEKGILQKKLGLLLCVEEFNEAWDRKTIAEALLVDGRIEEKRIQKRLKEVWNMKQENMEEEKRASAQECGVVYFVTY